MNFFHVTPAADLESVMARGLEPRIGPRSRLLGEALPKVYLFTSIDAVDDGLCNWLGDQFDEDETLVLLAVDPPEVALIPTPNAGYEVGAAMTITPDRLCVLSMDVMEEPDLRALPAPAAINSGA